MRREVTAGPVDVGARRGAAMNGGHCPSRPGLPAHPPPPSPPPDPSPAPSGECNTFTCYKGSPSAGPESLASAGCPLHSHPAQLTDNKNCTLCMECLRACPHRSVEFRFRFPGADPWAGQKATAEEVALMWMLLGAGACRQLGRGPCRWVPPACCCWRSARSDRRLTARRPALKPQICRAVRLHAHHGPSL